MPQARLFEHLRREFDAGTAADRHERLAFVVALQTEI